jgi:hypothetical protein
MGGFQLDEFYAATDTHYHFCLLNFSSGCAPETNAVYRVLKRIKGVFGTIAASEPISSPSVSDMNGCEGRAVWDHYAFRLMAERRGGIGLLTWMREGLILDCGLLERYARFAGIGVGIDQRRNENVKDARQTLLHSLADLRHEMLPPAKKDAATECCRMNAGCVIDNLSVGGCGRKCESRKRRADEDALHTSATQWSIQSYREMRPNDDKWTTGWA